MSESKAGANAPKITRAVQDRIGHELRVMYEEILKQPLPENLIAPLRASNQLQTSADRLQGDDSESRRASRSSGNASSPNMHASTGLSDTLPEAKSA